MRYFNTVGPCRPDEHYMVPPEPRLPPARGFIDRGYYFVVHGPRQSGKTTTLQTLTRAINQQGWYAAATFSCASAARVGDDVDLAERSLLDRIATEVRPQLRQRCWPPNPWPDAATGNRLFVGLREWAARCPVPLVLFFDEIDAIEGNALLSVLSQLRDGYLSRPAPFPKSVALCGLRDVRDYKRASESAATVHVPTEERYRGDPSLDVPRLTSSSPFNIKIDSLRMMDFTEAEVRDLYGQHTAATGQPFTDAAVAAAWAGTGGQPWLVNALAREVVENLTAPPQPITTEHIEQAMEALIRARATHLDSLVARLHEPRVVRVLQPMIGGEVHRSDLTYDDDVSYVRDLGLITDGSPPRIANPIYEEVVIRVLTARAEEQVVKDPHTYTRADGSLDLDRLLEQFGEFWREHAEVLVSGSTYHQTVPQLLLMAFLQKIVNGGGRIDREYGSGRGRIDLVVHWRYEDPTGTIRWQREAMELKVWHPKQADFLDAGLVQLDGYLTRLGLDHGTLAIFDRRPSDGDGPPTVTFDKAVTPTGRPVTVLRARL